MESKLIVLIVFCLLFLINIILILSKSYFKPKWISSNFPPKHEDLVLVSDFYNFNVGIASYDNFHKQWSGVDFRISYWTEIPK